MIDLSKAKKSDELFRDLPYSAFMCAILSGSVRAEVRHEAHRRGMSVPQMFKDCGVSEKIACRYLRWSAKVSIEDLLEILKKTDIPFTIEINGKTAVEHKRKD